MNDARLALTAKRHRPGIAWALLTMLWLWLGATTAAQAGGISGTVTNMANTPLSGINATAYIWDANGNFWQGGVGTMTAPNGSYLISGLAAGTYRVCFNDPNGVYAIECYNNASDVNGAMDLPVAAAQTVPNINAQLASAGHITGIVTNASAVPLAGITVDVQIWNASQNYWQWVSNTSTAANGAYDLGGLVAGTYRVCFYDWNGVYASECYDNASDVNGARDLPVAAGQTVPNINSQLALAGHITGVVTNGSAVPLAGIQVQAQTWDANQNYWQWVGNGASTAANGAYDLGGLAAGTYRICFYDYLNGAYLSECYDNASDVNGAMDLPVAAGQTVPNINAQLALAGHITGVVTNGSAVPLAGIQVQAQTWDANQNYWQWVNGASTAANGTYDLGGLATGTYRVCFDDRNGSYAGECYDNASDVNGARDLPVAAGQTVPNINAQLALAGHITGVVTNASAVPLVGIQVQAYRWDANQNFWQSAGNSASTAANGSYDLGGLAAGTYRVCFNEYWNGIYLHECYDNASDVNGARDLPVAAGQTVLNINAQLAFAGHITGVVTNGSAVPLSGIQVYALTWNANQNYWQGVGNSVSTAFSGAYDLGGLAAGTYRVCFNGWNGAYASECYDNASDVSGAMDLSVTAGQTVPNINAQLAAGLPIVTSVSPAGSGMVSCTPNPVALAGTSVCNAWPGAGFIFAGWRGDCAGQVGATCTLSNITSAKAVTATYLKRALVLPSRGGWRAVLGQ
ncbi:carboxypeptidase regulatory-like domain-containing protein [uncultured Thiodictyon sp.]|uniref:InlB B-repeat-containing protein n=3 Tax=uncultured Thiodictyon sp. TaxID=1846217 RepID=UPI0025E697A0|nr:carboxypeptidase regulatory-like domain-containing protein [uncultured Thiodictyon sp.]